MAKYNKTLTFTKAEIDKDKGIIIEHLKDGDCIYSLDSILSEWNAIPDISIVIKKDEKLIGDSIEE